MARIGICDICKGSTLNESRHSDCEIAVLEDLLYRIQKHLKKNRGKPLPRILTEEILADRNLKSLKEFLREKIRSRLKGFAEGTRMEFSSLAAVMAEAAKTKRGPGLLVQKGHKC